MQSTAIFILSTLLTAPAEQGAGLHLWLNPRAAGGMRIEGAAAAATGHWPDAQEWRSAAETVAGDSATGIRSRSLRALSPLKLRWAGGQIDLEIYFRATRLPGGLVKVDLLDKSGQEWLSLDHLHDVAKGEYWSLEHANIRVGRPLASLLGDERLLGASVGEGSAVIPREDLPAQQPADGACETNWELPNARPDIEVFSSKQNARTNLPDTIAFERCSISHSDGQYEPCTATSTTGGVVFAPDASLRNIGGAAAPWNAMFLAADAKGNDDHAYLIWNMYRVDRNGLLRQIGESGVKHAFYTVNAICGCVGGHVFYPGCEDTYSAANNDTLTFLGPRSEIHPHDGIFARCGSIFDADCDGKLGPGFPQPDTGERYRLVVDEEQLLQPDSRYYFEYWYVQKNDPNIFNSMGVRTVKPSKRVDANGRVEWALEDLGFAQGSAMDAWFEREQAEFPSAIAQLETPNGRFKLAIVAQRRADKWRYEYVAMNFDYMTAKFSGSAPDLKMTDNLGLLSLSIPAKSDTVIVASDGCAQPKIEGGKVRVRFDEACSLNWGEMRSFAVQTSAPPEAVSIDVSGASESIRVSLPKPSRRRRQR